MSVTLHDVARACGVSAKTVSKVVNGRPYVNEATRERVLDSIAKLGYQPNLSARNLKVGSTGAIGLAIPEISLAGYFSELSAAVIDAAEERNLVVLVEQTGGLRSAEIAAITSSRRSMTDGLILNPLQLDDTDAAHFAPGLPVVLLGEVALDGVDHVATPNDTAAESLTRHLLSLGRRRILVLGGNQDGAGASARLRLQGHRAGLRSAGLDQDHRLFVGVERWHRKEAAEAVRAALDAGLQFDAVFALNDALAFGAMRALLERGVRIPEDVAVVGFDDLDESSYSMPSLTTVNPDRSAIARTAMRLLCERVLANAKGESLPPRHIEVPYTLVERESTMGAVVRRG